MSKTYDEIIAQHLDLQEDFQSDPDSIGVEQVEAFIREVRESGANVADVERRDQLRKVIRQWAAVVLERTHEYPLVQLAPESRVTLLHEQADQAIEEGRLSEAVEFLQELLYFEPTDQAAQRQLESAKRELELEIKWREAETALSKGAWVEAWDKLDQIRRLAPEYRAGKVEEKIGYAQRQLEETPQTFLKRYTIRDELGRGTGGSVKLAVDEGLGRRVAVKHYKAATPDDQRHVERLLQEARTVAKMRHPNVAVLYATEAYPESGDYFVVMEYADGGSLADLLKAEGLLSLEKALDIGVQVCSALEYVHRQGIVHGDIKPSNILLFFEDDSPLAKLADFGLARNAQASDSTVGPFEGRSAFQGTLEYAAPEQFLEAVAANERMDLYSLGVVLYEMLVGEPPFPFSGGMEGFIHKKLEGVPTPPRELRPAVFDELDALVLTALAKSPSERFQSASEMLNALQRVRELTQQHHSQAQQLYDQGIRFGEQDQWAEAVDAFEAAHALNPELEEVESRLEEARSRLVEQRHELRILWDKAQEAERLGKWEEAFRLYERVHSEDKNYRDVSQRLEHLQRMPEDTIHQEEKGIPSAARDWWTGLSRRAKVAWIGLFGIISLTLCWVAGLVLGDTPPLTDTSTPTPTSTPIPMLASTMTPILISTSTPTLTSTPTSTPTLTPTSTPTLTPTSTPTPTIPTPRPTFKSTPTPTSTPIPILANASTSSSIFVAPDAGSTEIAVVDVGEPVIVLGRSAVGRWFYVRNDQGVEGFVHAPRFEWQGDFEALPVYSDAGTPFPFTPTPEYPQPVLGGVEDRGCSVILKWVWGWAPREDEFFAVRVSRAGVTGLTSVAWTKDTAYVYAPPSAGEYVWEVAVCQADPGSEFCDQRAVSERGRFVFSGCPPTPERP